MNIQEIAAKLAEAETVLATGGIDDDRQLKLSLLILDLRRQIRLAIFDTLKDLDQLSAVDTSQLTILVTQLRQDIGSIEKRNATVDKIVGLAKAGLRAAGVPIA